MQEPNPSGQEAPQADGSSSDSPEKRQPPASTLCCTTTRYTPEQFESPHAFAPQDLLALLKNLETEINVCQTNLRDENEKRKKYMVSIRPGSPDIATRSNLTVVNLKTWSNRVSLDGLAAGRSKTYKFGYNSSQLRLNSRMSRNLATQELLHVLAGLNGLFCAGGRLSAYSQLRWVHLHVFVDVGWAREVGRSGPAASAGDQQEGSSQSSAGWRSLFPRTET